MDKKWIDELSEHFHNKISAIFNIWVEIGIPNEKFTSRVQNIQRHINNLLDDMLKEERRHKQEVVDSIKGLIKGVIELSNSLQIDSNINLDSNQSILVQESFLLEKQNELKLIKKSRLDKLYSLLKIEDKLCSRLFEYKENIDDKSVPTTQLLTAFEIKITELEKLQAYRKHDFIKKRESIVKLCYELYNGCPKDAMIESIFNDDDVSTVPLSNDFLNQCESVIQRLTTDRNNNRVECFKLRDRYMKLHMILFPSVDQNSLPSYLSLNCEINSHEVLNKLKENVQQMESYRREKLGEFIAEYRNKIREKLRNNFMSHLESSRKYREILNSPELSDSLYERLEIELENLTANDSELDSLRQEMAALEKLFNRLLEINVILKDPIILKNRGGILLKVEKEKNSVKKELTKIEARVRKIVAAIDETNIVNTSEMRVKEMSLWDYIAHMWARVDGEKENEKKERSIKAALSNSSTSSAKKPLITSQTNISSGKLVKSAFKKPEIQNIPSKLPKKKIVMSPIAKFKTNLDHRVSKSFSSLDIKATSRQLTRSNNKIYEIFCEDVKEVAITSSFVNDKYKRK